MRTPSWSSKRSNWHATCAVISAYRAGGLNCDNRRLVAIWPTIQTRLGNRERKAFASDYSSSALSGSSSHKGWSFVMRRISLALGLMAAACVATAASAETINLTGTYRCIQMCRDGMLGAPTFVTQNGDAVNLTTETGESYRAGPDWNAPASRIWIDARGEGAVYSPDGMRIQFDDGRVWQREIVAPVVVRRAPVAYYAR